MILSAIRKLRYEEKGEGALPGKRGRTKNCTGENSRKRGRGKKKGGVLFREQRNEITMR